MDPPGRGSAHGTGRRGRGRLRAQRHPAGVMVDLVEDLESGREADRMQGDAQERYRIEGCFFLYGDPSRPCRASGSTQRNVQPRVIHTKLARTLNRHSRVGSGFPAAGQGAPGNPVPPAANPRPPARHPARSKQPAGRTTGPQGSPSADGPMSPRSPPAALPPAGARTARPPIQHAGSSTPSGSPRRFPSLSRS